MTYRGAPRRGDPAALAEFFIGPARARSPGAAAGGAAAGGAAAGGTAAAVDRFVERQRFRGRSARTVVPQARFLRAFARHLDAGGLAAGARRVAPEMVLDFFARHLADRRPPLPSEVCAVRVFLRDLASFEGADVERAIAFLPERMHRRRPLRGVLTVVETAAMLRARHGTPDFAERNLLLVDLLYSAALRPQELRPLRLCDWNPAARMLVIRRAKGGGTEAVIVAPQTAAAVDRFVASGRRKIPGAGRSPWLLPALGGGVMDKDDVGAVVQGMARAAGIARRVRPYDFRHAAATHCLEAGATAAEVGRLLRHRTLTSTAVYTRVTAKRLKEVHARCHPRGRHRRGRHGRGRKR